MTLSIPGPAAWCPTSDSDGTTLSTCGAYQHLSVPNGDQGFEIYYDASGAAVAIAAWESNPPCEGSCVLTCLAGPSSFTPPDPASCTSGVAVSPCGS